MLSLKYLASCRPGQTAALELHSHLDWIPGGGCEARWMSGEDLCYLTLLSRLLSASIATDLKGQGVQGSRLS